MKFKIREPIQETEQETELWLSKTDNGAVLLWAEKNGIPIVPVMLKTDGTLYRHTGFQCIKKMLGFAVDGEGRIKLHGED